MLSKIGSMTSWLVSRMMTTLKTITRYVKQPEANRNEHSRDRRGNCPDEGDNGNDNDGIHCSAWIGANSLEHLPVEQKHAQRASETLHGLRCHLAGDRLVSRQIGGI